MELIIILTVVGAILLGSIFCVTLIGGLPWSMKAERRGLKVGTRDIPMTQVSLGLMLLIFGTLWLMTWIYLGVVHRFPVSDGWNDKALHLTLQLPLALLLLTTGIAVLRGWKRWQSLYYGAVVALAISIVSSLYLTPAEDWPEQIFMYVLPASALAVIGGVALVFYIFDQIIQMDSESFSQAFRESRRREAARESSNSSNSSNSPNLSDSSDSSNSPDSMPEAS